VLCCRRYQNDHQAAWLHRTLVEVYEWDRFGDTDRTDTLAWLGCVPWCVHRTVTKMHVSVRRTFPLSPRPFTVTLFPFCSHCDLVVLAIHPDLFDYIMSHDPDDPSTSTSSPNFRTIFADALQLYKKRTKEDITTHSLAAQIVSCNSPNAVLTVLQTQVQTFDPFPSANEKWTRLLAPTITVLYAFSGFVRYISGPVNCETFSLRPTL
jgi:hypothetical protein